MNTLPTGTAGQAVIDAARNFALTGSGFDAMCRAIEAYETAPPVEQHEPTCQTCNDRGMVGGFVNAENGYDGEPCPDCAVEQHEAAPADDVARNVEHTTPPVEALQRAIKNAYIKPEHEEIGREYFGLGFMAGARAVTDAPSIAQPAPSAPLEGTGNGADERAAFSLNPLQLRWIMDHIRDAYEAGYRDARSNRAIPDDNFPGYRGLEIERSGGKSLAEILERTASPARAPRTEVAGAEGEEPGAVLPRFPVELRKMWSGNEVQRWIDERMKPRFKVLRNALEHIVKVSRGSRGQSRRNRWIELRALGALNGTDEWRTVDLPKNGEGVRRRLEHEIGELQAVKQELQKALAYWMPKVFDERSAHDAYLLVGYEGETEESWGEKMQAELARLNAIINAPQSGDFLRAVSTEAEHQRQRWGHHDAGKLPGDWYRLVGYLAHKALLAILRNDHEKAEHHVITTAAALANWHRAMPCNTVAPATPAPSTPYAWRDTGPLETGEGCA
ncbi:hypothetical protein G167_gp02 [Burkholderia phage BcepMigl]|uniref:Uncharacterized protein n=1 Tax=Burkholderia phage BcepMigl TaxID=2886899 RepID=I6XGB0_9CAUD|nr:hypothetical protein G167_gp02 [Burkholderia phage BcepMigl]AFN39071.1 hypothetical protein BcepMigl_gp02 [Burkholderia phage BcepMigl]